MPNVLIYGSSGYLGQVIFNHFEAKGWSTFSGTRDFERNNIPEKLDAVVWAQGANLLKPFFSTTADDWQTIFNANVFFITNSLSFLFKKGAVREGARLIVIGSVWGVHSSKKNKSVYISSKAAVSGLTRALASDFSEYAVAVNCVAPGIILSPMTKNNLSVNQIKSVEEKTPGNQLVVADNLAQIVFFLASKDSIGINGQTIIVDNGWSIHNDL